MGTISKYNIGKVYEDHLKASLVDALTKSIVDELTAGVREKVESMVRAEASKICIEGVTNLTNHAKMQEEVIVYLQWVDDKGNKS